MQPVTNQKATGKRLWSKEEDESLREIVSQLEDNLQWAVISQKFNEKMSQLGRTVKRTNKQCRERYNCYYSSWQNHLNPVLSNNAQWSAEEHHMLFTLLREHSQQWCQISAKLRENGFGYRSDNHIKNYFYSSIKKAIKHINELLKDRNRLIKKQKSIMLNYNQKYAYQRHLSLQRQVQIASNIQCESATNASNHLEASEGKLSTLSGMKIIKELDQQIVRKILLIAQSKGAKKFTISYKKYQEDAINTRNRLIDFIQNDKDFQSEDIIALATQILELSKKCKRKNKKCQSIYDEINYQQSKGKEEILHSDEEKNQNKKKNMESIEQNLKYRAGQRNQIGLLDKFLQLQPATQIGHKKLKQYDNSFNKQKDEMIGIICSQSNNISLDQSNPYLFGCDYYFVNEHILEEIQPKNQAPIQRNSNISLFDQSQNILQENQPYQQQYEQQIDLLRSQNIVKLCGSSGEFDFLNSIKEVKPNKNQNDHERLFYLDMNEEIHLNPFIDEININNDPQHGEGQKLFSDKPLQIPPLCIKSYEENQVKHSYQDQSSQIIRSQLFLYRSWAYSSNLLKRFRVVDENCFDFTMKNRASAPM